MGLSPEGFDKKNDRFIVHRTLAEAGSKTCQTEGSCQDRDNGSMQDPTLDTRALDWTHRLTQLGSEFFTRLQPTPLAAPAWAMRNTGLLFELGWPQDLLTDMHLGAFAGNAVLPGADPLATVYSGHQFGQWAGQLGDGRALWLGEANSALGPQEIQLKGAGRTPYSRGGDGRAVLRSSIREYLCSEAMHGLGIPTTRALSLVVSPQPVRRETVETAAVVTRVAPSFLRFGHFEHFSAKGDTDSLRALADHAISHHLPECHDRAQALQGNVYAALLQVVQERTAHLMAQWQAVGFCHGVMNTDNMSLLGLTIDYGPFQFMDGFDPGHICNHTDTQGRYAYSRQPNIAYWNLFCLAQALLPLIEDKDLALQVLEGYKTGFPRVLSDAMRAKLGLTDELAAESERDNDWQLVEDLLQLLASERVDYTIFWRRLSHAVAAGQQDLERADPLAMSSTFNAVQDLFIDRTSWQAWLSRYLNRLGQADRQKVGQTMLRTNPKFVLRNHLAEIAIRQAQTGDYSEIEILHNLLQSPFDEHPGFEAHAALPPDWAGQLEISCSS
jgi:serine/tyrosine/threonine adenylyltransferase